MRSCLFFLMFCLSISVLAQENIFLKGYNTSIKGEVIHYESNQPDANTALLVRSMDEKQYIEWETEPFPSDYYLDTAIFVWIAGIDVNNEDAHSFNISVNGNPGFVISNPPSIDKQSFSWKGNGMRLEYKGIVPNKHSDFMGYMYLHIPANQLETGRSVRIKVVGENADSQSWYMTFEYQCRNYADLYAENAILNTPEGPSQQLRFNIIYLGEPTEAVLKIGDQSQIKVIQTGFNTVRMTVPLVDQPVKKEVHVSAGDKVLFNNLFTIEPAKTYSIHLLHHSHVDIGYTHIQEEVEKMQWSYLDDALEVAKRNTNYPPEAQTKWNVEVMWAVTSYFNNASDEKKKEFIKAVQDGTIELDALYGNELLALCNEEELYRLTEHAREIAKICGVKLQSAMITDVPGWTWGVIPVLAKSGVRYFSIGTNASHRRGDIIEEWGDRPFYWVSPSSKDKILCWIHEKGYSMFHAGLNLREVNYDKFETLILTYSDQLSRSGYKYDIVPLRYNIGSDNGPLDLGLSDFVKEWNERYISPKLIISTVSKTFSEFESKYSDKIPSVKGDITAYWEDGAASSAKETAINRANAERLVQAQTLWALRNPDGFTNKTFTKAWEKVLLYDEHTWGAYNSISEPESEFVKQQWNVKRNFALDADNISKKLLKNAINAPENPKSYESLTIYNSNSWDRTDMVYLPPNPIYEKSVFMDEEFNEIRSQVLSDGRIAIKAVNIQALSGKQYTVKKGKCRIPTRLKVTNNTLENEFLKITVDEISGVITEITDLETGTNIVNDSHDHGFNQYLYVDGRTPDNPKKNSEINIRIGEKGYLVSSLIIESNAPGTKGILTEIVLTDGMKRVEIINRINKKLVYSPEGVHIAFPFHIPNGIMRIDMPFGYYQPDKDQLPGSNKNFFTIRRWTDLSNSSSGVTWISPDAPLIELNKITSDAIAYGWVDHVNPSGTLYSYVMNNYWETNYLAGQEGEVVFRYYIIPHSGFIANEAEKRAREICQPLIASFSENSLSDQAMFTIKNEEIILGSIKPLNGNEYLIRFDNVSDTPNMLNLHWLSKPGFIYESNPYGDKNNLLSNYVFNPFESKFVLVQM